jgi:hypothetical protein
MLAKVLAFALVLGIVPVTLVAFGGLPAEPRKDLVDSEVRQVNAEEQWRDRVGAVCGWQRKQVKLFNKAFRDVATPADVEFALKGARQMIDDSQAIFSRLDPPFEFQRESRILVRLLQAESASLEAMTKAFHDLRRHAFVHSLRRFIRLDARSSALLNELGGAGCRAKPMTVPNSQRLHTV